MKPDFTKIQNERVGYQIRANDINSPKWLETITFGQFIPPYTSKTKTPRQVYQNLEQALTQAMKQQDSVTDKKSSVMLDVLATATLQREAMRNAMGLIQKTYL